MHWADVEASKLLEISDKHVVATGISPSGHIHVGNMREILTGDGIYRALKDKGAEAEFIYIADSFDPLRKVYPFLDSTYEDEVGKPLSEIRCPCGRHENYAEHFLEPFLNAVKRLGIEVTVLRGHEMYKNGEYGEKTKAVLDNMEKVKEILREIGKSKKSEDWIPYEPKCEECGKIKTTKALAYEHPFVIYRCQGCGHEGKADIRKDDGKLPWRVEWAARWAKLGVTVEPFGKDHAAAGGSYDTGVALSKEVFGSGPPHPVVYEWIQLKGRGAMSSSKGITVSAADMLRITPPEVMRHLVMKNHPNRHIDFDPGLGILNLIEEYDKFERLYFGVEEGEDDKTEDWKRTYELSQVKDIPKEFPVQVPYKHLVNVVQIADDWEGILAILKRTEQIEENKEIDEIKLRERVECVKSWLDSFAPENVKFSIKKEMPEISLDQEKKGILERLALILCEVNWNGEEIHNAVYRVKDEMSIKPKTAFEAVYLALLGQKKGPRLGYFLSTLEKDFVIKRLEEASK